MRADATYKEPRPSDPMPRGNVQIRCHAVTIADCRKAGQPAREQAAMAALQKTRDEHLCREIERLQWYQMTGHAQDAMLSELLGILFAEMARRTAQPS